MATEEPVDVDPPNNLKSMLTGPFSGSKQFSVFFLTVGDLKSTSPVANQGSWRLQSELHR